ncbi:MAG: hypothetical protein ABJC09_15715 [Terriglobia bacterium]
MTRREILAITGAALAPSGLARAAVAPPAKPVAVSRCTTYNEAEVLASLKTMFDQLGGLRKVVGGKTVTVKLNLTGSPGLRFEDRPLGTTHYTHPTVIQATAHLMGEAGAKRIRFVESAWALSGPLEGYLLASGWNVGQLTNDQDSDDLGNDRIG